MKQPTDKKKVTHTHSSTYTYSIDKTCCWCCFLCLTLRSIQSHQIFSVQFCLVRCRVIVNLWVFTFAHTPLTKITRRNHYKNIFFLFSTKQIKTIIDFGVLETNIFYLIVFNFNFFLYSKREITLLISWIYLLFFWLKFFFQ